MTPSEFKAMWKRDLLRAGLKQKDVVAQMLMRHTQVTPSAISQWVKQGYPPRGRIEMLTEILGRDSEFAGVPVATWESLWAGEDSGEPAPMFARKETPTRSGERSGESLSASDVAKTIDAIAQSVVDTAAQAATTRQILELPERFKPLFQRIREATTKELVAGFRPSIPDRPQRHIPAYQYGELVAEFAYLRDAASIRQNFQSLLFKLAVMKQAYDPRGRKIHMLLIVDYDLPEPKGATTVYGRKLTLDERGDIVLATRYDAHLLGLEVGLAADLKAAAQYLEGMAFGKVGDDPEQQISDEIEAEDEF